MSIYFSAATILSAALIALNPIDLSSDSTFEISQTFSPCQSGKFSQQYQKGEYGKMPGNHRGESGNMPGNHRGEYGKMPGNHRGGYGQHQGMIFNSNQLETVTGKVLQVDRWTNGEWEKGGVHVVLQTDNETMDLHLGPSWYIDNQDIRLEPNDQIQVTGIRVTSGDGRGMMVVSEVSKGNQVITLRDEVGFPTWMRGR
ncbi:hypothetical protein [Lyngbya sp. PCC 8106]|uniref:hypothetical protein n=1 Tax=Lyngbya sp. (strain PCC 8106) TaxID=313612 RepID=UPI0000EAB6EE|nr:hypothetical protein [Lyngbya sp. PCC 8106]EAW36584.1 hypothetical protein L8106_28441 [Lyngbya sp. PCC 8106]